MTLGFLVLGVVLCLAGTRVAALAFFAAAVAAVIGGGPLVAPAVWTAVAAAGLLLIGAVPRRIAVPAAAAAAVLVAAATVNAAVFLLPWTIGTVGALACSQGSEAERRWGFALVSTDLVVAAGVVWGTALEGFVAWPPRQPAFAILMVVAAGLRAPLVSGAGGKVPEAGVIVIRLQVAVLLVLGTAGDPAAATLAVASGAAGFALGPLAARAAVRDAVQEAGLIAMAVGAAGLGWTPGGWLWAALAVGTLLHLLRLRDRGPDRGAEALRGTARSGVFGSPVLAVCAVAVGAAVSSGDALATAVVAGVLVGLGGRVGLAARERRQRARLAVSSWPVWVLSVIALGAGLWAPIVGLQPRAVPQEVPWPDVWALVIVAAGAAAGARWSTSCAPGRPRSARIAPGFGRLESLSWVLAPARTRGAVTAPVTVLASASAGLWTWGWFRGFL